MQRTFLACFALAAGASAQSFDAILPTTIRFPAPSVGISASCGILVNTSDEVLDSSAWDNETVVFAEASEPILEGLLRIQSFNAGELQPGEATGQSSAEMLALLDTAETFIPDESINPFNPVVANDVAGTFQLDGVLQFRDQRIDYSITLIADPNALGLQCEGAQRLSSTTAPVCYEAQAAGCPIGGTDMRVDIGPSYAEGKTAVSTESTMPVLGNPHLVAYLVGELPVELVGTPYFVALNPAANDFTYQGCELSGFNAPLLWDVLEEYQEDPWFPAYARAAPVPIPLADAPALAGVSVALQWGVFTELAPNGAFSLSAAQQVTLAGA